MKMKKLFKDLISKMKKTFNGMKGKRKNYSFIVVPCLLLALFASFGKTAYREFAIPCMSVTDTEMLYTQKETSKSDSVEVGSRFLELIFGKKEKGIQMDTFLI